VPVADDTATCLETAARTVSANRAERAGVYALDVAQEAFAARALLARAAERTLDVQCYIWRGDTTGFLLFEELWKAADRGVAVRLLLDDNGTGGLDSTLAALDTHRNIQVRLFNPFVLRRVKALGYLIDFTRLNRRMHNKSFTADGAATIVGGRNVGDEYFGADHSISFADLDVLALGPVAAEVRTAFDRYWNHRAARRVDAIVGRAGPDAVAALHARFAEVRGSRAAVTYIDALCSARLVEALVANELELEHAEVRLLCDPPSKIKGRARRAELVFTNLTEAFGKPEREIDVVSPYFVPGKNGTRTLARYAKQGIAVRVLTNSLAATDVSVVHSGYAKWRKSLLRAGVKIHELKPDAASRTRGRVKGRGSSAASLHIKTFCVDRKRVFVGSLNLDPRSIRLNTEMGLVIESARIAETVREELDRSLADGSYEVLLVDHGRRIEWLERTALGEIRYRTEPKTSLQKRLAIWLAALLPIEWLL
jgi:putative cardiolipin synthase